MPSRHNTLSAILEQDSVERTASRRPAENPLPIRPARKPGSKAVVVGLAAVVLLGSAAFIWRANSSVAPAAYGVAQAQRGDIEKTITATGKLQALTTVQVGTQVSGAISELHADFNSRVSKGQVIARLDPSQFQAQFTQSSANLASAQAGVQTAQSSVLSADAGVEAAQANVERTESVLANAQRTLDRTRELVAAGASARQELDTAEAAVAQAAAQRQQAFAQMNQAKAQAQSARSQLNQARAQAQQAEASVQLASVNLEHTVIRAPIDGVVIARNVDVGQTVAASLQAPTIFLIANDLTRMQVLADIDEADVGQLGPDSRVTFTVDAYPSDDFAGRISQIRLAPQSLQNVVTYTAVIEVANPDLKLKPGMTANVTAVVAERKNVLTIPNAALRFRPEQGAVPGVPAVWRIEGESLAPVHVRLGLTDGISSEVLSDRLKEGDRLAIVQGAAKAAGPQSVNPFQMRRGARR